MRPARRRGGIGEEQSRRPPAPLPSARAGQPHSFEQRLFEIDGRLADGTIGGWSLPYEIVASEPIQAYSWWVDGDGDVSAFVDHWGMAGRRFDTHPETLRGQFGGTPAPTFRLAFDGDRVKLAR